LKPAVFLGGTEFRLRISVGKRFVSQTLPRHQNNFVYNLKHIENDVLFFMRFLI